MAKRKKVRTTPITESRAIEMLRELQASPYLDVLITTLEVDRDEFATAAVHGAAGAIPVFGDEEARARDLGLLVALLRGEE